MNEPDVLYCYKNPDGIYVRFDDCSPYMPVVPVTPGLFEPGHIQCFYTVSDAECYRSQMRDHYLKYADAFDELSLTWVTDGLLSDGYIIDLIR